MRSGKLKAPEKAYKPECNGQSSNLDPLGRSPSCDTLKWLLAVCLILWLFNGILYLLPLAVSVKCEEVDLRYCGKQRKFVVGVAGAHC
jgi:hypothetical protein